MNDEARKKMLASLERAKAIAKFEDAEFEKNLQTPKWNHKAKGWRKPLEVFGGFGEQGEEPKKAPPPPPPHDHPESIAEFDESGKMTVRPLPDCEEIDPAELYDHTEADRYRYARKAQDTFYSIAESETGRNGDPERLNAQWSETETLKSQTHQIAAMIENASRREADFHGDESLFEPMYRETEYGVYSYYLFSKVRTQAPKFRNSCFLPYMASQTRGKMLKALESYLEQDPFARFVTFTSGDRVGLEGIRERTQYLHKRIRKLNHFLKGLGLELVFRATEFGTPEKAKAKNSKGEAGGEFERGEKGTPEEGKVFFHVHAHCLMRHINGRPFSRERWSEILEKIWNFWGHQWDEGGSIKNIRELCKYVSKPQALLDLEDWELLQLYRETNSLHLVQPLGLLRDQIRDRKERKMRLEYRDTPEGKVLVEVHDWNCSRDEKDEQRDAMEKEQKERKDLSVYDPNTVTDDPDAARLMMKEARESNAEPEIRILAKCVPGYAPGSLVKEPRIVVMATNWNQRAIERHPLVVELMRRTWEQWQAGQQIAAAIRLDTGAITVRERKGQLAWFEVMNSPPPPPPEPETVDFQKECTPV